MLEIEAILSDEPERYEAPLEQLSESLVKMLAPAVLHPDDSKNALLALEAAYANGLAELEHAGYNANELTVYSFWHKLQYLQKRSTSAKG